MQDKQSKDLYERISFHEMSRIKNYLDTINNSSLGITGVIDLPIPHTDDVNDFTYGFTPQKIKETLQWLISEGYLNGSKMEITSTQIILNHHDQSPITEKGMEYYKKLSKNYGQEYLTELAKKYFDKKNKNNSEK